MEYLSLPKEPEKPQAERIALEMLKGLAEELERRVQVHRVSYNAFWNSPVPPDDILKAMGANAAVMLANAGENVDHIARVASFIGKTVTDYLPEYWWKPRRTFIPAADGTVTLAPPPFGHDAWGRFIPVPDDPFRIGYLPEVTTSLIWGCAPGEVINIPLTATNGPVTWIVTDLPEGLVFDGKAALIGSLKELGDYKLTIEARNERETSGPVTLTIVVAEPEVVVEPPTEEPIA